MSVSKKLLAAVAVGAAGYVAARQLAGRRDMLVKAITDADGDEPIDPLAFPVGSELRIDTADGGNLTAVDTGGSGPTALLIHGFTGTRGHWGPVAARLVEEGWRVVAYEQRGHGDSTVGDSGFTMAALGNDVRRVLEHLDLRDIVVAGHSMGGMAVMSYLTNHPESSQARVRAAILTSTSATPDRHVPGSDLLGPKVLDGPWIERALEDERRSYLLRRVVGTPARMTHLDAARRTLIATRPTTRVGAFTMLRDYDLRGRLGDISVPCVVTCGSLDRLTPVEKSHEIAALVPDAQLVIHDEAGHMLPWERTERLVELFVEQRTRRGTADLGALTGST